MTFCWRARLLAATFVLGASRAGAQVPAEHVGLTGGFYVPGHTTLDADGAPVGRRWPFVGLSIGTRIQLLKLGSGKPNRALSITPQLILMMTDIRGVDEGDPFAFAIIDPSLQVALRVHRHWRPYVTLHAGQRTMERRDTVGTDSTIVNFWGDGKGVSFGVEIPLTREGRGLDIGWGKHTGHFTTREWIDHVLVDDREAPTRVRYSATMLYVGWKGPFRGGWPWQ